MYALTREPQLIALSLIRPWDVADPYFSMILYEAVTSSQYQFGISWESIQVNLESTENIDKTGLKADREDWGGHPLLTLAPLKTPRKTQGKRTPPGPLAPGAPRHQGNQRNSEILRKSKEISLILNRTHTGTTRDHPGSHRTTFSSISQQSQTPTPKGTATPRTTCRSPEP